MKVQHEFVVGRTIGNRQTQSAEAAFPSAHGARRLGKFLQSGRFGESRRQFREPFSHDPHPVCRGINVGEYSQDASAASGATGECVDVQQVVSLV